MLTRTVAQRHPRFDLFDAAVGVSRHVERNQSRFASVTESRPIGPQADLPQLSTAEATHQVREEAQ